MNRCKVVKTAIGTLWGRDCIFLDNVTMSNGELILTGTINTDIVLEFVQPEGMPKSGELPYEFTFRGVLAVRIIELDTWESQNHDDDAFMESSFEEILDSSWLSNLGGKISSACRHFRIATYDDIVEVISGSFEIEFKP